LVAFALQRVYWHQQRNWLDQHHPLPNGERHDGRHISRIWIAGLAAVLSLGYVLLTAQKTQDQTIALTRSVARCWQESYESTRTQIRINRENDLISRQQQGLQRDYDRATADWLKALVNPPGDLANQPTNSPARQAWGLDITGQYQAQLNALGAKSDQLVNQRNELDVERAQHPLPEATCGK
jgi:hypothetical protein